MRISRVLSDLQKMVGMTVRSIKPGAEITLRNVDLDNNRLEVLTKIGRVKSRKLDEIRKIWLELCRRPAVHVDAVLEGSGTSRNQPETLIANLPYVEWLSINRKKHIAFVRKETHELGTLKRMDAVLAEETRQKLHSAHEPPIAQAGVLLVVKDVRAAAELLEDMMGELPEATCQGAYHLDCFGMSIRLVTTEVVNNRIRVGTYAIVPGTHPGKPKITLNIAGLRFCVVETGEVPILVPL